MKDKIKELKPLVHRLKPIIQIGGKGLTEAVQAEINQALEHHELIKIRICRGRSSQSGTFDRSNLPKPAGNTDQ
jgi:RNA-binding protein YhbY